MKNRIRIFLCMLLLNGFAINFLPAQELTGIWRGHFRSSDGYERSSVNYDDRYKIEVQIAQTKNRLEAVTYSYKNTEFYGKAEATGSLNTVSKKVLLKEIKLVEVRVASGDVCVMTCFMQYSKLGDEEYLQGTYVSTNTRDSLAGCGKGSIFLHRVTMTDFHKEPFLEKKEKELLARKKVSEPKQKIPATIIVTTPVTKIIPPAAIVKKQPVPATAPKILPQKKPMATATVPVHPPRDSSLQIVQPAISLPVPPVLQSRRNELLKTITVNHSIVELRIYDDGAIDNDSVSVYYDNKLIISKARLTDQPITIQIAVEPSEHPHQLVVVAENLGDIPPNTSLLVVQDGDKRYEERIISTEQKNIVVNFQYKKIE